MSDYFQSPTYGRMNLNQVIDNLIDFILKNPKETYQLIVGTDSEGKEDPEFVTAIVIHQQGKGGRFFYQKSRTGKKYTLRTRIYEETMKSLTLAVKLRELIEKRLQKNYPQNMHDLEIHTDIGQVGETKEMIKEIVGMVKGNGFEVKIKPESFGATSVADHCLR
jgi:predicted RNase H-related nuclease YkuK (DUF458 family)